MRSFIFIICLAMVVMVAYWAYTENYTTQASKQRVQELHDLIAKEKEEIAVLEAEWAYLNRPERLKILSEMNFERLGLVPLAVDHFGELETVPLPPIQVLEDGNAVSVIEEGQN